MARKAINAWYNPDIDIDIAEWDETCTNRSAFVRDAIREKIQRLQAAETREQETLDHILIQVADARKAIDRIMKKCQQITGGDAVDETILET